MSSSEGSEGSPSCYHEQYGQQDVERVLGYINERREDGASCISIAKGVGIEQGVVEQIVVDLVHAHKVRRVYKGGAWLIFPPLEAYDKSIEQVVSEEQDRSEPVKVIETPTRHKCLVTWCECMVPKKGSSMRDHLRKVHNLPEAVAEHAVQLLREGRRIDFDAPRFLCQYCGEDQGCLASKNRHEPYCHKNPDYQKNVDAMRIKKYGKNAILGELTIEKFEARDKSGIACPICGSTYTGKGSYPRAVKHIRTKHEKSAKEAKDILKLASIPCTDEQCVIGPESVPVQAPHPDNCNMSAVLEHLLEPKPMEDGKLCHGLYGLHGALKKAASTAEEYGFKVTFVLEPIVPE